MKIFLKIRLLNLQRHALNWIVKRSLEDVKINVMDINIFGVMERLVDAIMITMTTIIILSS